MAASAPKEEKEVKAAIENMDLKNDRMEKKIMDGMNQYLEKMFGKMEESI